MRECERDAEALACTSLPGDGSSLVVDEVLGSVNSHMQQHIPVPEGG